MYFVNGRKVRVNDTEFDVVETLATISLRHKFASEDVRDSFINFSEIQKNWETMKGDAFNRPFTIEINGERAEMVLSIHRVVGANLELFPSS